MIKFPNNGIFLAAFFPGMARLRWLVDLQDHNSFDRYNYGENASRFLQGLFCIQGLLRPSGMGSENCVLKPRHPKATFDPGLPQKHASLRALEPIDGQVTRHKPYE